MYLKIPRTKIARIEIVKTDRKLSLQQVVAKYKCDAAINGGLYDMHTGEINPITICPTQSVAEMNSCLSQLK